MSTRIKSDKIAGTDVEIHATENGHWLVMGDDGEGNFSVRLGHSETLSAAKKQAQTELAKKKVKVAVPFVVIRWQDGSVPYFSRGIAHSLHAKSNDALVRYDDGETDSIGSYGVVFNGDTPRMTLDNYAKLATERKAIQDAMRQIESTYKIDLRSAVRQAINAEATKEAA